MITIKHYDVFLLKIHPPKFLATTITGTSDFVSTSTTKQRITLDIRMKRPTEVRNRRGDENKY